VNRLLTDQHIRQTCRALLASGGRISGREVRRVLKERFESVGNTERIFKIWREEHLAHAEQSRAAPLAFDELQLLERVAVAEAAAAVNLQRAERAELRELAHQDRWAMEVDQLRQAVKNQPKFAAEIRSLQEQVLRLTVELHAARKLLAERQS
jgi:predicted phage-related endonuclease